MADKKPSATLTGHLDKMPPWVRETAVSLIGDVGTVMGIGALSNYLRGKSAKQVTNQDLDRVHGQLSEVDQKRTEELMVAFAEYSAAINASSDPDELKKRKIEDFRAKLVAGLPQSKKDGEKAKEAEPKDFNGVLKALDDQTMRRFRAWYDVLDDVPGALDKDGKPGKSDKARFDERQNEVTVDILKSALANFELSSEMPEPDLIAGRFSSMLAELNPDQRSKFNAFYDALASDDQDDLDNEGDRIPRKIFLAEIDLVAMPKKRESEDFLAFRSSMDEALGNRFDLFESVLSAGDRVRLNAIRTWLTKDALRTWLPAVKGCDAASATLALEQLEQYAAETKATAAVAFGRADAAKILRRLMAGMVPAVAPKSPPTPADRDSVKVKKVLAYVIGRLKPPAKPLGEVMQELKNKVESMTGDLNKVFHSDKAKGHAVDPATLPPMKKMDSKQVYFERIKNLPGVRQAGESDPDLQNRLRSAIEHKDAQRMARIKKWLESGGNLEDLRD